MNPITKLCGLKPKTDNIILLRGSCYIYIKAELSSACRNGKNMHKLDSKER
jgi:hypothetical protein